jgi:hypothetical protein
MEIEDGDYRKKLGDDFFRKIGDSLNFSDLISTPAGNIDLAVLVAINPGVAVDDIVANHFTEGDDIDEDTLKKLVGMIREQPGEALNTLVFVEALMRDSVARLKAYIAADYAVLGKDSVYPYLTAVGKSLNDEEIARLRAAGHGGVIDYWLGSKWYELSR